MPVSSVPQNSKALLMVQTGTDTDGKPVVKTRTYNNIKAAATDENVYSVMSGIASLQEFPIAGLKRVDSEELVETI